MVTTLKKISNLEVGIQRDFELVVTERVFVSGK